MCTCYFFSLSLIWLMILYINLHVERLIPVTLTFWRSKLHYFTPLHVYVMFLHDRYIVNKPPKITPKTLEYQKQNKHIFKSKF